jgi:hypothetical protein
MNKSKRFITFLEQDSEIPGIEAAKQQLAMAKRMLPFREWCAIYYNREWTQFDSMRKLKTFMRKNNISSAPVLTAQ